MKNLSIPILILSSVMFAVTGCSSSGKAPDRDTTSSPKKLGTEDGGLFSGAPKQRRSKSLSLPPDLVSTASETVSANNVEGEKQAAVLPQTFGSEIKSDEQRSWLQVDADATIVWRTLSDFWALHKITLVEADAKSGLMETDWFDLESKRNRKGQGNAGIFKDLFNRVVGTGTTFDKYRVRLERGESGTTNVYVSHNATVKKEAATNSPSKLVSYEWVAKDSDPEKVAILLQQMVLLFESDRSA